MDWLPNNILDVLKAKYDQVEILMAKKDSETEPYKSKYEAKQILLEMADHLKDKINDTQVHSSAIGAMIFSCIGCIDMDTQELAEGELCLKKALDIALNVTEKQLITLANVKTLNQLGVLWCMRDNHEKAEFYLKDSLKTYEEFSSEKDDGGCRKTAYNMSTLLCNNESTVKDDSDKSLELLNAYTYYFLAQVYQKSGKFEMSAKCCHTTLSKQLELKEYQALEWARNAATLSHHYTVNERFEAAKLHLAAATFVLARYKQNIDSKEFDDAEEKEILTDAFEEAEADVDRSWGKFALMLLESSMDAVISDQQNLEVEDITEDLDYEIEFSSIELDPALTTELRHSKAKTFEEARAIFLPAQRAYNKAKLHFTLNNHCTDFAEIQQDLSRMHKVLIFFETEEERQFKMHKRRIDLLESVYKELNAQMYTLLCRQLVFEIAETYSSMMDIKFAKYSKNAGQQHAAKVNALVELSRNSFKQFLDLCRNSNNQMPKEFDKDVCRPALMAYFHMGRLSDKYVGMPEVSEMRISSKLESLRNFKYVVDYCSQHPEAEEVFKSELTICKELVKLLPVKIRRMQAELTAHQQT